MALDIRVSGQRGNWADRYVEIHHREPKTVIRESIEHGFVGATRVSVVNVTTRIFDQSVPHFSQFMDALSLLSSETEFTVRGVDNIRTLGQALAHFEQQKATEIDLSVTLKLNGFGAIRMTVPGKANLTAEHIFPFAHGIDENIYTFSGEDGNVYTSQDEISRIVEDGYSEICFEVRVLTYALNGNVYDYLGEAGYTGNVDVSGLDYNFRFGAQYDCHRLGLRLAH